MSLGLNVTDLNRFLWLLLTVPFGAAVLIYPHRRNTQGAAVCLFIDLVPEPSMCLY